MIRILLLLGILFAQGAEAKVIVVSDIDDTLKISHVQSMKEAPLRAYDTSLHFSGMRELFQLVAGSGEVDFFYVSNAPSWLMGESHEDFLRRWRFPAGELKLRPSLSDDDFKRNAITEILERERPETVIFLGDNGEKDAAIYHEIVGRFPEVRSLQFIRIVYSGKAGAPLFQGQMGFVSPVEISLVLGSLGFLSPEVAEIYAREMGGAAAQAEDVGLFSDGFFPNWMNCRDFRWLPPTRSRALSAYNAKIKERCALPFRWLRR